MWRERATPTRDGYRARTLAGMRVRVGLGIGGPLMNRSRTSQVTTLTACWASLLILLAGCTSSPAAETPPTTDGSAPPASGDAVVAGVDIPSAIESFASLDAASQQAELGAVSASVETQLMVLSGLDTELGGPAQAAAAYAVVSDAMRRGVESWTSQSDFGRFGARIPAADTPSEGGMIAANLFIVVLGADAAVQATNDLGDGKSLTDTKGQPDDASSRGSLTVSGSAKEARLEAGSEVTANGVTGKIKSVLTVAPCPDVNGQFTATTKMTSSISKAGASTGANLTVDVAVTGQVDDTAHLVSQEVEINTQSARFESGKGQFVDISTSWSQTGDAQAGHRSTVNRTGGAVTESFVSEQFRMGLLMAVAAKEMALGAATKGMESGRCVNLQVTTSPGKRTGLTPSTAVSITAAPRSKIDGAATGGTVVANLNGKSTVDPAGTGVPADAAFAYVAPGEEDESATVSLEARSKRGVGRAEVSLDTKGGQAYSIVGGADMFRGSGTICDLAQPFTVSGSGVKVSFTPSGTGGGTYAYAGSIAGFPVMGQGSYVAKADENGGTLVATGPGSVVTPRGTKTANGTENYTLTPIPPCE